MKKLLLFCITICGCLFLGACGDNGESSGSSKEESIPSTSIETSDSTQSSTETPEPDYGTTYNRPHPDYYVPGVPLIEEAHVVYMNFDGFAQYYYDELVQQTLNSETPNLKKIIDEGVGFSDLRTALPSITNPCQNMILTGATSAVTKNVYRYYDKTANTVIQQERQNENKTIVDVVLENDMSIASVAHFLAESKLSTTNAKKAYIYADSTNPKVIERGSLRGRDHFSRFEQLIKLVKKEEINSSTSSKIKITSMPNFTMFYADDLDAIGHNEKDNYGYIRARSEKGRMENVITLLKDMDAKLGDFIAQAKAAGVYDSLTFFLTTDHGMNGFGWEDENDRSDIGRTKLGDLAGFLKSYDKTYTLEMVKAEGSPKAATNVVAVGANLDLQLSFRKGITEEELQALKTELLKLEYVGKVFTRAELEKDGYWTHDTDMIITPGGRYCFSSSMLGSYLARGQHDSALDTANRIYGAIWGKGIKKGYQYEGQAFNYDFGTTMAAALGLQIPNANGVVLDVFQR